MFLCLSGCLSCLLFSLLPPSIHSCIPGLLGEKGASLCQMHKLGLPVPPAFTLSTDCCVDYRDNHHRCSKDCLSEVRAAVTHLEAATKRQYGATDGFCRPLLLSVRPGVAQGSCSGQGEYGMKTVLNVGMNEGVVAHMITVTNNAKWAYRTYIRFLQMFSCEVMQREARTCDDVISRVCSEHGVVHESYLDEPHLVRIIEQLRDVLPVPDDPWLQLTMTLEAVYRRWFSRNLVNQRSSRGIPESAGCAITVQTMVYGNLNLLSGTGIAVSRDPHTGEKHFYGHYLGNAEVELLVGACM